MLELNREEINCLSKLNDDEGYAWKLYLSLKKKMNIYTGLVQISSLKIFKDSNQYLQDLIRSLNKVGLVSIPCLEQKIISVRLPLAFADICLEHKIVQ